MTRAVATGKTRRREIFSFIKLVLKPTLKMTVRTIFSARNTQSLSELFAELYSKLWDFAEHSISHKDFDLPSTASKGAIGNVNALLCELYGSQYSSLSFGGSSGAMLTLLTGVFSKLYPQRDLILFDDVCHQSTIGGLIFGRWKAVRLPRDKHIESQSVLPTKFQTVKATIERHGAEKFAAIILVLPSYDGFRSPSEDQEVYAYATSVGIPVIVDGAWDALRFFDPEASTPPLSSICDVWITSPHKRGLTPSSLGCMLTHSKSIAQLWDEALDLGFRSSSVSFVEVMVAEHRLSQILQGEWDDSFRQSRRAAQLIRDRMTRVHPDLVTIKPADVQAETHDPTHILISTHNIPHLDARDWAKTLANDFAIDVEKATASSLLLICGAPIQLRQIDMIISNFRDAINTTLKKNQGLSHDTKKR